MTSQTTDTEPQPTPRVQGVQLIARLIYEDGTVGAVATQPTEIERDQLDSSILISDETIMRHMEVHAETLLARVQAAGANELYKQATKEAQDRRDNVNKRAILARQQKAGELQAGKPYNEVGRNGD